MTTENTESTKFFVLGLGREAPFEWLLTQS
jgi:hypothetical protein